MNDSKRSDTVQGKPDRIISLAVLVLIIAFLVQILPIAYSHNQDRVALKDQLEKQAVAITEIKRVRAQLEAIGGKTAQLAQQGNESAIAILEQFKMLGVNIKVP